MPFRGKQSDLASDRRMAILNSSYANGTKRETVSPDTVKWYRTRFRASLRPKEIVGKREVKQAFKFEAPARETSLGAYKEERMMRGRAKSAYNIITGRGVKGAKRMVLTAPDSGMPSEVMMPGMGDYVTVPEGSVSMGAMGQVTVSAEDIWKRDLDDFTRDVQSMHMFTTNSQEVRYYEKAKALVENGKKIFATNAIMLKAIAPLAAELTRWREHRAWALTQAQGTSNRVSITKVQTRLITALNYIRTGMGLAPASQGSILPEAKIPEGQLPNVPGAPGTPTPPAAATPVTPTPEEMALMPSWFQRNKTLVIGGVVLASLIGGYVWYKRRM